MLAVRTSRTIAASPEAVFDAVANGRNYGEAIPDIDTVEYMTTHEVGLGARFRETRRFSGWKAIFAKVFSLSATESEVIEFDEGRMLRYVTEEDSARSFTTFTVTPIDGDELTRLDMLVEVTLHSGLAKLVSPLLKVAAKRGLRADLDAVKAYVEAGSASRQ